MLRELEEEVWIKSNQNDIAFKAIVHHKDDRWERIYFVAKVVNFTWEVKNMEEDKAEEVKWFDLDNLPEKITPQVEICLNVINKNICYSEYWF